MFILVDMYVDVLIQPFGADDSDVGSPNGNHASAESSKSCVPQQTPNVDVMERGGKQIKENENSISENGEADLPSASPAGESYRSMGEILSAMDPGNPLPVVSESGAVKAVGKVTGSNHSAKRSAFWGRNNVSCLLFIYALFSLDCRVNPVNM